MTPYALTENQRDLQLLIVDDHTHLVEELALTIDWNELGFSEVHKAFSAQEALEIFQTHPVDVVISDIRMPGMSGLELIKEIKAKGKHTKCVLLTGYSDFDYAREALKNRADGYLLKPFSADEVRREIVSILDQIKQEWMQIASQQKALYTLRENLPLLRNHLLMELLQEKRIDQEKAEEKLALYDVPFAFHDSCCLMLVRMDDDFPSYSTYSLSLLQYAIANIAEELFGEYYHLWQGKDSFDYLLFVVKAKSGAVELPAAEKQLMRHAMELQHQVRNHLKGSVSILLSEWGVFPQVIRKSYLPLVQSIRNLVGMDQELLLTIRQTNMEDQDIPYLQSLQEYPTLSQLLDLASWEAAENKLERIFNEVSEPAFESEEFILEVYYYLCTAFSSYVHKNGKSLILLLGEDAERMRHGHPLATIRKIREWSGRVITVLKSETAKESRTNRESLIDTVKLYIADHIEQATLSTIADHVDIHPVYLSKLFKNETGDNISNYLYAARMKKAMEYIVKPEMKIYEIAEKLGYNQAQYFIKLFKNYYGATPQEYRDQLGL